MRFHIFRDFIISNISTMRKRLRFVCLWYLISLMVETRKHSLTFASELSGISKSAFSKFLMNNEKAAKLTLDDLSKRQAEIYSKVLKKIQSLPWRVAILTDSTIQSRSSLKSENVQRFNHGKGFVIGHQRTNIILFFNGIIIPLPPIPFLTRKFCEDNELTYMTEHDRVTEYLNYLNLIEYIGFHKDSEVVVLTDSGYDCEKIQNVILEKGWHFVTALKNSRGVKSEARYAKTPKSREWDGVARFFKKYRKLAWETVCILTDGPKKKRKEFRVRHTEVFLKNVGKIRAVCSEFRKKRDGRRRHIAMRRPQCNSPSDSDRIPNPVENRNIPQACEDAPRIRARCGEAFFLRRIACASRILCLPSAERRPSRSRKTRNNPRKTAKGRNSPGKQ